jgi:signal transduction histidine kinase
MRMSLGLALASKIIHEQGGRIEVVSVPGQGTTVAISFPEAR